jgi:hypothetical protein
MFLIIITLFWAFIGTRLIGDLDGYLETNGDPYRCNYLDLGITFTELYALFSYDDYPDLMAPVIANSLYYLLYFIPYALLILYILLPIPVAVVFEAFRTHRSKLVILDRIKQREALLYAFVSLDYRS